MDQRLSLVLILAGEATGQMIFFRILNLFLFDVGSCFRTLSVNEHMQKNKTMPFISLHSSLTFSSNIPASLRTLTEIMIKTLASCHFDLIRDILLLFFFCYQLSKPHIAE